MKPPLCVILPLLLEVSLMIVVAATDCRSALGVESGAIRNSQFSASSSVSDSWQPWEARLNSGSAWIPRYLSTSEWLQVDLLKRMSITGIQTQGQDDHWRYVYLVTSYKLLYSDDGTDLNWNTFQENGSDKIFEGNIESIDADRVKTNYIDPPIVTRFIRLMPVTWSRWGIGLRLELLGCELESNTTSAAPPTTETLPTTYLLSSTKKTTTSAAPQRSTSTSISSGPEVTSPSPTNTSDGSTDNPAGTTSATVAVIGCSVAAGVVIIIIIIAVSIFFFRSDACAVIRRQRGDDSAQINVYYNVGYTSDKDSVENNIY
ncbi:uncharacterized protein LOC144918818 [Branchiostoma floridae x Branchiostoma belcheri]